MRGSMQGSVATRGRFAAVCSALVLAALAIPAAASGDLIYTAPDDQSSGFFCSESQPCALVIGINLAAADDDEVLLAPGSYETSAELEVANGTTNVTIRPRDPGTRPVIVSTASPALQLSGAGTTVRGIDISHNSPSGTGLFGLASSNIRNVVSISNGDTPCQMANGLMTDTTCIATATSGRAMRVSLASGNATTTVRNATLFATGSNGTGIYASASDSDASVSLDVASTIAVGDGFDVETDTGTGGSVDVALAFSNFETRAVDAGATVTAPTSANNQTEEPIFTGFGLEQDPDSPTVDAGIVDAETGTTDVYGDRRPQGVANDIGADELFDTVAPQTRITTKPKRRTKSRRAKFKFASNEPALDFVCKFDKGIFGGGEYESCGASITLRKVKPGRHTMSVKAIDTNGNMDQTPAKYRWKVKKKG